MSQVLVRPDDIAGDTFVVRGGEAHHVARVLRKTAGSEIDITDGAGLRYTGVITRVDVESGTVEGRIRARRPANDARVSVGLLQGLPRGAKFDYVVEKATELGADVIIPYLSRKNPIRLDEAQGRRKRERWLSVARAAVKQCERSTVPEIVGPVPFAEALAKAADAPVLVLDPDPAATPFRSALASLAAPARLFIMIGPESGFDGAERAVLHRSGAQFVRLGPEILRTETAGLAALAVASAIFNWDK